jgi:hypothetical protein
MKSIIHRTPVGITTFCAISKTTKSGIYSVRLSIDRAENPDFVQSLLTAYDGLDNKFLQVTEEALIISATSIRKPRISLTTDGIRTDYKSLVPSFANGTKGSLTFSAKLLGNRTVVADLIAFDITEPVEFVYE